MPNDFPVMLGSDNERHNTTLFGDTACGAEHLWAEQHREHDDEEHDDEHDDEEFSLVDTGETDVTCPACLDNA